MRTFSVEQGMHSPGVLIDEAANTIDIYGNSTLLETQWFYGNVLKWIIALNRKEDKCGTMNIRLHEASDSSLKWLKTIITRLQRLLPYVEYVVNWQVDIKNPKMLLVGQFLRKQPGLKVNIIAI